MRMRSFLAALAVLLFSAQNAAARGGMPTPLTPRGELIESIYYQIFVAGTVVFVIVMVWLLVAMWKFRANGGSGRATFEHERESLKIELAWIGVPLIVVLWVGYISYAGLIELDEGYDEDDAQMTLHIVGQKWFWQAQYDDFSVNANWIGLGEVPEGMEFYVPSGVPVLLNITGVDVIHAFHIMDANNGPVALTDANPFGPHKYTREIISFPDGEYKIQCREMCGNPGHAYMRATIIAVPMAEYQTWYDDMAAGAAAGLEQSIAVTLTDGGLEVEGPTKTAQGATVNVQFANARNADATWTSPNGTMFTVPAGDAYSYALAATEAVDYTFTSGTDSLTIEAVVAEIVKIKLGDLFIEPKTFTLEVGNVYVIEVDNAGKIPHNFYIGDYSTDEAAKNTLWKSRDLNGGEVGSFLVVPTTTMTFDTWCNIPGHAGGGMLEKVVIA